MIFHKMSPRTHHNYLQQNLAKEKVSRLFISQAGFFTQLHL